MFLRIIFANFLWDFIKIVGVRDVLIFTFFPFTSGLKIKAFDLLLKKKNIREYILKFFLDNRRRGFRPTSHRV